MERPPAWRKITLVLELLERGHEFVLWTDADSVFVGFERDILDEVRPGKDLYLVEHTHPAFLDSKVPNCGVMLVRNSDWSRALFQRIWDMTEYVTHNWWENAALIHLFGYRALLGEGPHAPDPALLERVRFLDDIWNQHPEISPPGEGMIRHYAGMGADLRRTGLRRDAAGAARALLALADPAPEAVPVAARTGGGLLRWLRG